MLTNQDRKHILNEFLRNISDIADIEHQKRVWIRGEGPECDDFGETMCCFFEDCDPILKNYQDFGISDNQFKLLKNFQTSLSIFSRGIGRQYLPQDFIDTKEWGEIMKIAKEVLKSFDYINNLAPFMNDDKFKNYLYDLGFLIKEKAKEAKKEHDNASGIEISDYQAGYLMAFHEIIDLMKQQASAFDIDQQDISLADIDPDSDLL